MTRLPRILTLTFLLSGAFTAGLRSQEFTPRTTKVLDTDTTFVNGAAEPASGRFVVYATQHALSIYNRQTKQTTRIPGPVDGGYGSVIAVSQSGNRLIFPRLDEAGKEPNIWMLDLDTVTGAPRSTPRRVGVSHARNATLSPDGRWIAMTTINGTQAPYIAGDRLVLIPADGGNERMLDSAMLVTSPRWSPDGKFIAYRRNSAIAKISPNGGKYDSLAVGLGVVGVSPDSRFVAVGPPYGGAVPAGSGSRVAIEFYDINGVSHGRFPVRLDQFRIYAWTKQGLIAYKINQPVILKTIALSNGAVTDYPVSEPHGVSVRFSPDGSKMAEVARRGMQTVFVITDVRTLAQKVVTPANEPDDDQWAWSPDGSRIGFLSRNLAGPAFDINVADVSTGTASQITKGLPARSFRWTADSKAFRFAQRASAGFRPDGPLLLRNVTLGGDVATLRTLNNLSLGAPMPKAVIPDHVELLDDSLFLLIGNDSLVLGGISGGQLHTIYRGRASRTGSMHPRLSPDKRWIALAVPGRKTGDEWMVLSLDGAQQRRVGGVGCGAGVNAWLPNSRQFLGWGSESCDDWKEVPHVMTVDGSTPRMLKYMENEGYTLSPDGRSLFMLVDAPGSGSLVAFDVSSATAAGVKSGKN